jgi:hypothetical protein
MTDKLPYTELPARATRRHHLAKTIAVARELAELRLGYEIELAMLEPVDRDGQMNMLVHWRRKPPALQLAGRMQVAGRLAAPTILSCAASDPV